MTEPYKCQSYVDDEGTLQNCTCGRCGEGVGGIGKILDSHAIYYIKRTKGAIVDGEDTDFTITRTKKDEETARQLFELIASEVIGEDYDLPSYADSERIGIEEAKIYRFKLSANKVKAEQRQKLKKVFGIDTGGDDNANT